MNLCDYCRSRCPSLLINCGKCSPSRPMRICRQCSVEVNQLREHSKHHPSSTYQLCDIPLDDRYLTRWLCLDEIRLIEMIESCGLGNWIDVANRMSRDPNECRSHFEEIYLSPSSSPFNLFFSSFSSNKRLIGEEVCNVVDLQSSSIIYPPMLVESEEQRLLTYMPHRDEYEREYHNEAENRLPGLTIDDEEIDATEEEDPSRRLLRQGKLALLRAYAQILRRRLQLKHYIRDYAIGLTIQTSTQPDQQSDLHQISRFLSADEYERLVFNHRRILSLLEELGCSPSNRHDDHSSRRKDNEEKTRRRPSSIVVSLDSSDSDLSLSSNGRLDEVVGKRRSVRRVSSSSSSDTSSRQPIVKEPLYTRRRVTQSDTHTVSQRMTRSTATLPTPSDISWDSSEDDLRRLSDSDEEQFDLEGDNSSSVASRTRSHTPPDLPIHKKQRKNSTASSPTGKKNVLLNGSSKFHALDQSTPKINRMLTRHQLVVQQMTPNNKRKVRSNSIDDELIQL